VATSSTEPDRGTRNTDAGSRRLREAGQQRNVIATVRADLHIRRYRLRAIGGAHYALRRTQLLDGLRPDSRVDLVAARRPLTPLYARAASDNAGSLRMLEKTGFRIIGTEVSFAPARAA
jgi:hypothetical protein